MIKMPKLSIITVNLNNREGLRKTAESVVSQTYKDYEWIVIDGGSTDGSKELIEQYAEHISYWVSEPDKGIYNAMNKGIRVAKGEYILFLNSGDYLIDGDMLNKVFAFNFDEDVVYGNQLWDYGDRMETFESAEKVTLRNFIGGTIQHSGVSFIKREMFEEYGLYDENYRIVSDWKWFLIAVGLGKATTRHIGIFISVFDMNGISVVNTELAKKETVIILDELVPPKLLIDYDNYSKLEKERVEMEGRIRNSKAYRLGNAILKPLKFVKCKFMK